MKNGGRTASAINALTPAFRDGGRSTRRLTSRTRTPAHSDQLSQNAACVARIGRQSAIAPVSCVACTICADRDMTTTSAVPLSNA